MTKKYGWIKQLPDFRDYKIATERIQQHPVDTVDLRPKMPPVYDQGDLGSCTANAIAAAVEYQLIAQKYKWPFTPSRLFIYYNERSMENSIASDAGADARDGMISINKVGVCPENLLNRNWNWAYDINKFAVQPPTHCYINAQLHKSLKYEAVPQTQAALTSIIAEGLPIGCGITVYDSFESDSTVSTGVVPMPNSNENMLGGHYVLLVGYDSVKQHFIFRNSWGTSYGQAGYGFLPFAYVLNPGLSGDFWVIQLMK
jgi:C1A family cysteine protease